MQHSMPQLRNQVYELCKKPQRWVEIHFDSLFQSLETEEIDQGVLICVLPSKWSLGKQLCQEENQNEKETYAKHMEVQLRKWQINGEKHKLVNRLKVS